MRQSTKRQRAAIEYCCSWFPGLRFTGNLADFDNCSMFLKYWLDKAKAKEEQYEDECYEALSSIGDMYI